jgi:hypothetical protein
LRNVKLLQICGPKSLKQVWSAFIASKSTEQFPLPFFHYWKLHSWTNFSFNIREIWHCVVIFAYQFLFVLLVLCFLKLCTMHRNCTYCQAHWRKLNYCNIWICEGTHGRSMLSDWWHFPKFMASGNMSPSCIGKRPAATLRCSTFLSTGNWYALQFS